MRTQTINGVEIDPNVLRFPYPPNYIAYTYKSMWAYGNHYQLDENEGCMVHATYDNGVAYIFNQGSWCFAQDQNIIVANMHALCRGVERDNCGVIWRIMPCSHEVFMDSCKHMW